MIWHPNRQVAWRRTFYVHTAFECGNTAPTREVTRWRNLHALSYNGVQQCSPLPAEASRLATMEDVACHCTPAACRANSEAEGRCSSPGRTY
jgi:hypothetical protein